MKRFLVCFMAITMIFTGAATLVACDKDDAVKDRHDASSEGASSSVNASSTAVSAPDGAGDLSQGGSSDSSYVEPDYPEPTPAMIDGKLQDTTIYLVGDSTVCDYDMAKERTRYLPRNGYGMWFNNYLYSEATVVNLAASGRSTLSYLKDSAAFYERLKTNIKRGDYLVIGFGHNDEKGTDDRFADANGDRFTEGSFKYNLYNYYIKVALEVGATPILCTPIARYSNKGDYSSDKGHITADSSTIVNNEKKTYPGGDYPKAIRELGDELGLTVIDLTAMTIARFTEIGVDAAKEYFSYNGVSNADAFFDETKWTASLDGTHVNSYGASRIAEMFVNALSASDNSLKNYINAEKVLPLAFEDVYISKEFVMVKNGEADQADGEPRYTGDRGPYAWAAERDAFNK